MSAPGDPIIVPAGTMLAFGAKSDFAGAFIPLGSMEILAEPGAFTREDSATQIPPELQDLFQAPPPAMPPPSGKSAGVWNKLRAAFRGVFRTPDCGRFYLPLHVSGSPFRAGFVLVQREPVSPLAARWLAATNTLAIAITPEDFAAHRCFAARPVASEPPSPATPAAEASPDKAADALPSDGPAVSPKPSRQPAEPAAGVQPGTQNPKP